MSIPTIICSLFWKEPKERAATIIFKNGTKEEVEAFVAILRRKVAEHKISDVSALNEIIWDLAFVADAKIDTIRGEVTLMNEAL